jgi:spore maturation protein CgeB
MRFVMFYHSLLSDWNHGNAHFLRGVSSELVSRGHDVVVYEPRAGWSITHLLADHGAAALAAFAARYPQLEARRYEPDTLDLDAALEGADVVIAHEWNDAALVRAIGARRRARRFVALFHDTHHRAVTEPDGIGRFDHGAIDGVLAFGEVLRQIYLARRWCRRAFTWHEAADTRVFRPLQAEKEGDLVWIGNWGDGERSAELCSMLIEPVRALGLRANVHGVRYPPEGRAALLDAGIDYHGWLANFEVPAAFARHRVTVHIPRGPYTKALPGIPTIRMFEALACGIPLVSAPWEDREELFRAGEDYRVARDGEEMKGHLSRLLADPDAARAMAQRGLRTLLARHTCRHRVDQLLEIVCELEAEAPLPEVA